MNPRQHRESKPAEMDDAQIEAIVAEAIAAEAARACSEAAPPSSAIVWWRAQVRARHEAAAAADRPISIVHGLAIACGVGLALSLIGTAFAGVRGSAHWLKLAYASLSTTLTPLAALDLSSRWVMLPMTVMLATLVIASIAAYFIFADE